MNLTYTRPGELRKPDVEVLPDGRIRITRYIAAGHGDRDYSEVTESVGTTDLGLGTALLVKRGMARIEGKDAIVKTYEVRNAATETKVGLEDVQYGENGLKTVIADWVQMSSGTYVPQTVGTTTSTYDPTCVLRSETMEDDGTTRQIRRVYINKGLLLETNETKNNGALLLKTLVYLNDAPSPNPPTGYTLISTRVENPNGLETTTYTFAKGSGQISQDDEIKNNGALLIRTIRYLTDSSVTANPIATPTGYTNVSYSYSDQDGYRVWTASYAKGNGKISESSETRLSGALLRSTIVWLTDPSVTTQPTTDPLSGGTIVSQEYADRDGYRVWTVVWAKGVTTSNIIETVDYRNKGKLVVYTRQRLNAAPTAPSATIGGTVVLIEQSTRLEDGYTLYSATWAEGKGTINSSQDIRNQGKLIIYQITSLAEVPATPSASIGGSVVLISDNSREDNGVTIYERRWAEGKGTINYSYDIRITATLASHSATSMGIAPSTPSPVIAGTIVSTAQRSREDSGVTIYEYEWIESAGNTVGLDVRSREDGSITYNISVTSPTQSTPAYPGTGTAYLVDNAYERGNGYYTNRATYIKPPVDFDYPKQVSFTVPGLLTAANPPVMSPPVNRNLMATAYVTYSTSKTTDIPYTITKYAVMSVAYKRTDDKKQYGSVKGYDGYVGSSSYVASNVSFAGVDCDTVAVSVGNSIPSTLPSGLTILAVDCEKYLTATDGTIIWRNISIKYTF